MGAPQYEQAGADVAGTGTTNTIPRWTGASTLGDSGLIDNGTAIYTTTRNVGIGTASPTTSAATGSLVIGQNNVSQQWAARIYGGNDANRAPVLSLFRAGNTEGIIAEIKNGAVGALALGITGGVANFNDATLSAACQVQITSTLMDISGASYGLKLPATPGNPDTQTLDAYQEIGTGTPAEIALTLTCGTSGTITVNSGNSKARVTRVGNKVIGHGRIVVSSVSAPLGRLSCTLTGCPQPFTFFVCETRTNDTTGVASGNIIVGTSDTSATPIVYFDRYSPNTRNDDAAANMQAGTTIVFSFSYSV